MLQKRKWDFFPRPKMLIILTIDRLYLLYPLAKSQPYGNHSYTLPLLSNMVTLFSMKEQWLNLQKCIQNFQPEMCEIQLVPSTNFILATREVVRA